MHIRKESLRLILYLSVFLQTFLCRVNRDLRNHEGKRAIDVVTAGTLNPDTGEKWHVCDEDECSTPCSIAQAETIRKVRKQDRLYILKLLTMKWREKSKKIL